MEYCFIPERGAWLPISTTMDYVAGTHLPTTAIYAPYMVDGECIGFHRIEFLSEGRYESLWNDGYIHDFGTEEWAVVPGIGTTRARKLRAALGYAGAEEEASAICGRTVRHLRSLTERECRMIETTIHEASRLTA